MATPYIEFDMPRAPSRRWDHTGGAAACLYYYDGPHPPPGPRARRPGQSRIIGQLSSAKPKTMHRHIRTHSVTHPPDTERRKYAVIINKGKRCSDAHCQDDHTDGGSDCHLSFCAACTAYVICDPEPAPCARGRPKTQALCSSPKRGDRCCQVGMSMRARTKSRIAGTLSEKLWT